MEHELKCVLRNPSAQALQRFEASMAESTWTVSMAETVLSAARKHSSSLYLLATAQWDDHVVHALEQPLKILTERALQQNESTFAMVAAARMWEALERIRSYTSPLQCDTLWMYSHVDSNSLHKMAHVAVNLITSHSMHTDASTDGLPSIDPDVVRESCVSFLCLLLIHNVKDWMLDLPDITNLTNPLEQQVHRLHDSHVASPASIRLALSSVVLLTLVESKYDESLSNVQTIVHSTSLVDHVCKVAFPSHTNSPSGPQWTDEPMATDLRPCACRLLRVWSLTGEVLPDRCWSNFFLDSWTAVLESRGGNSIPRLLFLHTACHLPARQALHFVLGRKDVKESCRVLVASLMNHFQQKSIGLAASSAALLRALLHDRRNVLTHDELSRSLWSSLEMFPIDKLLDGIVKLASSDPTSKRACQPLLVGMLDVLELLVSFPEGNRSSLLEMDTKRVESLIEIMSTKAGSELDMSLSMEEMEEDTPTTNNLSRLDESHLSLEPAPQTKRPTGLEDTIRIAAATILMRMAQADHKSSDEDSTGGVWEARMRAAVVDFASTFRVHGHVIPCADMKRRFFRLQAMLANSSAENEDIISSSIVDESLLWRRERDDHTQQMEDYQRQLDEAQAQMRQLTTDRDRCKTSMRTQAAVYERDLFRIKSAATRDASQLAGVHVAERSAAEKRAEECLRRANQVEELRQEAEGRMEEFRLLEANAKQELRDTTERLRDAHSELQQQRSLAEQHKMQCAEQANELAEYMDRFRIVEKERQTARMQLDATQSALKETKRAYKLLQDDLEATFANLSLLAQAYQIKEEEVFAMVEQKDKAVQEARRQADAERRRNEELEQTERHLQFENDRLTKKLARAKEKLQEERQERHDEAERRKRHGPVSYINQLHTSTTSEASSRAQRKSKTSREERRRLPGKENGSSSSSSMRRDYR